MTRTPGKRTYEWVPAWLQSRIGRRDILDLEVRANDSWVVVAWIFEAWDGSYGISTDVETVLGGSESARRNATYLEPGSTIEDAKAVGLALARMGA